MKYFKIISIAIIFILFTVNLQSKNSPERFFKLFTLSSFQLIDSILVSPSALEQMVNDTNYFRLEKNSNLTKRAYLNKLIEFMKSHGLDDYKIKDLNVKGYKETEGMLYQKLDVIVVSKKTNKRINFFLDINEPENQWKINYIYVYEPWENLKYE